MVSKRLSNIFIDNMAVEKDNHLIVRTTNHDTMKAKDIFNLAVRVLGLVFLYHGLLPLPTIIPILFTGRFSNICLGLLMVGWPLLLAYWLLRGAPPLFRGFPAIQSWAYPDSPTIPSTETKTNS